MEGPVCYWGREEHRFSMAAENIVGDLLERWRDRCAIAGATGGRGLATHRRRRTGSARCVPLRYSARVASLRYRNAWCVLPAAGGLGGLCTPSVDAMGARPIAGAPPILLKNSSHPEDLAAALPIVSRITPDGYGVQAQVLKQLILGARPIAGAPPILLKNEP